MNLEPRTQEESETDQEEKSDNLSQVNDKVKQMIDEFRLQLLQKEKHIVKSTTGLNKFISLLQ